MTLSNRALQMVLLASALLVAACDEGAPSTGNGGSSGSGGAAGSAGAGGMGGTAGAGGTGGTAGAGGTGGMGGSPDMGSSSCGACNTGSVCCESPLPCAGMCVPDCRLGGSCPNNLSCNQSTGICEPGGASSDMHAPMGDMPPPPDMPPPGDMHAPMGDMPPPPDMPMMMPMDGGMPMGDMGMTKPADLSAPPDLSKPADLSLGDGGSMEQYIDDNDSFFYYGESRNISISNQMVAVGYGSNINTGEHVHVWEWDGTNDVWGPSTSTSNFQIITSPGHTGDGFGNAVKLDSAHNRLIVGAFFQGYQVDATTYISGLGAAYIYTFSNGSWTIDKGMMGTGALGGDTTQGITYFGWSVGLDDSNGTIAAVGEPLGEPGHLVQYSLGGEAFLFTRTNMGSWKTATNGGSTVTASDPIQNEHFGFALDMSGGTLVVGAPGYPQDWKQGSSPFSGRAKVFSYSYSQTAQTFTVTEQATLQPAASDQQDGENFGASVSFSGNSTSAIAVVGAPYYTDGLNTDLGTGLTNSGAAYIYTLSGGTWSQSAKLLASDESASARFGYSVTAVSQTRVLVGAPGAGKVYSFSLSGGNWTQDGTFTVCNKSVGAVVDSSGSLFITRQPGTLGTSVSGIWVYDLNAANTGCLNLP